MKRELFEPQGTDFIKPFYWKEDGLYIIDQRKLPLREIYFKADSVNKVVYALKKMLVRGAPAIGIVTAIGVWIGLNSLKNKTKFPIKKVRLIKVYSEEEKKLSQARPTAVNLFWALKRMRKIFQESYQNLPEIIKKKDWEEILKNLQKEALQIWEEDILANLKMAELGSNLLPEGHILTHCNTGALATGGYGTALGVIRKAWEKGKSLWVWVDETRPLLQGARLTAWELEKLKIPFKIITDNTAGYLMKKDLVKAVIVGADRITRKGDTANKIGTYSLSVLAKEHNLPFYVCAPSSTFDLNLSSGEEIPIEEREEKEVLNCGKTRVSPNLAKALNLAFDITPSENITAFITEKGIIYPPFEKNIQEMIKND